jgi:anti-sigma factor RsiW
MDSRHPETALVPYLRGELTGEERDSVERHLAGCVQCRVSADSSAAVLRKLAQQIDELPEPDWRVYRAELRRKLGAAQESQQPFRFERWRPRFAWASLATAGVAVAALLLVMVMHPGRGAGTPPVDQLALEDAMSGVDLGLLRSYPVVARLDLLENYDVIEHLDELTPADRPNDTSRS